MNVESTKKYFEENQIVAVRAYKSEDDPSVEEHMAKLGNKMHGIPYYAIYGPGLEKPITFDGYITAGGVQDEFKRIIEAQKKAE